MEQLAGLALDEGISAFVLGTDDADDVRRTDPRGVLVVTGHHTLEDRSVFTHLRRSDPHVGPVFDRLHEEHEVIASILEDVDRALVDLVSTDGATTGGALESLAGTVDLLTDVLLSHLAYEERELLHPLAQHGLT